MGMMMYYYITLVHIKHRSLLDRSMPGQKAMEPDTQGLLVGAAPLGTMMYYYITLGHAHGLRDLHRLQAPGP